jgi:threonine/homoserine/homoserine lactone efflux protein
MPMSDLFISLLTFAVVATISPGGATTLATASGVRFGFLRSVPLLLGIALGVATLIGLVAGGLGSVVESWPEVRFWLRLLGSAYLLWLALSIGRMGRPGADTAGKAAPMGLAAGFVLLWVNPKGWTMAIAAAGAYAALVDNPFVLGAILGAVFGLAAVTSLALWCAGGSWLAKLLHSDRQWRVANCFLGFLLAASVIPMWR